MNIRRIFPLINEGLLDIQVVPSFGSLRDVTINFPEHLRLKGFFNQLLCLFSSGPDIFQVHLLSLFVGSQ